MRLIVFRAMLGKYRLQDPHLQVNANLAKLVTMLLFLDQKDALLVQMAHPLLVMVRFNALHVMRVSLQLPQDLLLVLTALLVLMLHQKV